MSAFVNLHNHTTYSRQDGWGTPEEVCARVKALGQPAVAVTDHGVLTGHVPLWQAAKKADLKPIFGSEFYIVDDLTLRVKGAESLGVDETPHVTVIALTQTGYRNLLKLSGISYQEGFYFRPRIDWPTLAKYSEGLAVLTGCVGGYPSRLLHEKGSDACAAFLLDWSRRIERFYVEVNPCPGYHVSENTLLPLVQIAVELGLPLVVTSDSHFPCAKDYRCQDILFASGTGRRVDDPTRTHRIPAWQYQCGAKTLYQRVGKACPALAGEPYDAAIREGLANGGKLAAQAEVELPRAEPLRFAGLSFGETAAERLKSEVLAGLQARRALGLIPREDWQRYLDRCDREYEVIKEKGFCDYLLIVADIIRAMKKRGAVVLTRGSAGGCCLMWAMGASVTDPIRHDLSFERFFDASRNDPPDIDVDFPRSFKAAALEYVQQTYGAANVAQLANFAYYGAKGALRAVAKALGIDEGEVGPLSAALSGDDDDLTQQLGAVTDPKARAVLDRYPELALADRFVGQVSAYSIHACGVIISPTPLNAVIGLMRGKDEQVVSSIDKRGAKALGHLKMDLLTVDGCDIAARCLELIGEQPEWLETLPLDDAAALAVAKELRLAGIFQLDKPAASRASREIGLDRFEDLDVAIAICRPGPAMMIPFYAASKTNPARLTEVLGRFHPTAADITKPTLGLLLYQEQVMKLAERLAGLPLAEVQSLRKGVSDKLGTQPDQAKADAWKAEWREKFVGGCVEQGVIKDEAERWWGQIETHGGYCLTGDTVVIRGGAGRHDASPEITIADLYAAQQSRAPATGSVRHALDGMKWTPIANKIRAGRLTLLQMDTDGRVRPGKLKSVASNGIQPVVRIQTQSGKSIKTTLNHRFLTPNGYRTVDQLRPGIDHLVVMGERQTYQKRGNQNDRAVGKKYVGRGTPHGEENPAWIDGRTVNFEQAKQEVLQRAKGFCEGCLKQEEGRFEFAHLMLLDDYEGDYSRYHSASNLMWLCNSCHKRLDYTKGERVARWTRGRVTELDPIISIEPAGDEEVFDVSMNTPEHNFVANGLISHNSFNKSHSRTYALLAYWMCYLKAHHAGAFYAAYLSLEKGNYTRARLIREFQAMGGEVRLIDPVLSRAHTYSPAKGLIVGGYADLAGVGDGIAAKILAKGPFEGWDDFLDKMTPTFRARIIASGLPTGQPQWRAIVALAPWFPVGGMPSLVLRHRELHGVITCDQLPAEPFDSLFCEGPVKLIGFVSHKEPNSKGVEFSITDETGLAMVKVAQKKLRKLGPLFAKIKLGDLICVTGWWSGDCLYVDGGPAIIAPRPVIKAPVKKRKVKSNG
jgi:DNA-directed DNA polymerase III PolC